MSASPSSTYDQSIKAICAQVWPSYRLRADALSTVSSLLLDASNRISSSAGKLADKSSTPLTADKMEAAMKTFYRGCESEKHAIVEGLRAASYYEAPNGAATAFLQFSVDDILSSLESGGFTSQEVDIKAAAYLTGVLEHMCADLLESTGQALEVPPELAMKNFVIRPFHIAKAVAGRKDLTTLFPGEKKKFDKRKAVFPLDDGKPEEFEEDAKVTGGSRTLMLLMFALLVAVVAFFMSGMNIETLSSAFQRWR